MKEYKLKNKAEVTIRPIMPEDELMLKEMFDKISSDNQKHIYFEKIKDITHETMQRYTHIDYDREMSLVAEIKKDDGNIIVGISSIITIQHNNITEFSVVVADAWKGKGLGGRLTEDLLDIARQRGVRKIYAKFVDKNNPVIVIFKKHGFNVNVNRGKGFAEIEL